MKKDQPKWLSWEEIQEQLLTQPPPTPFELYLRDHPEYRGYLTEERWLEWKQEKNQRALDDAKRLDEKLHGDERRAKAAFDALTPFEKRERWIGVQGWYNPQSSPVARPPILPQKREPNRSLLRYIPYIPIVIAVGTLLGGCGLFASFLHNGGDTPQTLKSEEFVLEANVDRLGVSFTQNPGKRVCSTSSAQVISEKWSKWFEVETLPAEGAGTINCVKRR